MDMSSNGASTSVKNTPQAQDDVVGSVEDVSIVLDVMANDLGGAAKTLYSLDQSNPLVVQTSATSQFGAKITMVNGKVVYDSAGAPAIEALAQGQTLVDTFTYAIRLGNGAISTATVRVTVTGTNDAPILSADTVANHALTEQAGMTGSAAADTASATLKFTDVDLNDTHTVSIGAAAATWSGGATLPGGLQATLNAALKGAVSDSAHTGAGSIGLTFSAADGAFDFLSAGETLKVTYNVTVTDNNGATSTRPVTFTVTGTNDAPVVSPDAAHVHGMSEIAGATAGSGAESASATLNFTDVDLNDTHTASVGPASAVWSGGQVLPSGLQATLNAAATASLTDSTHSGAGSVGVAFSAADNAFDFLAAGETLTVKYDVTVTDSQGALSTQTVTFIVTGTNDAPVLAADTAAHLMGEIAGVTAGAGVESASATLSFTDVDLNDTHSVGVSSAAAVWSGGGLPAGLQSVLDHAVQTSLADATHTGAGSIGVNFAAADSAFDFLAAGETLTVKYDVTVTDSQGAPSTQTVTFVITGTNDAPVLAADTGVHAMTEIDGATAGAGVESASTTLSFTDVDLNDTHTVGVSPASAVWSGGGLPAGVQSVLDHAVQTSLADATHTGAGSIGVNFAAADGAFDFLAAGETLTVKYDVTVTDSQGAPSTQTVTFVVTGTNDAPVLAADVASSHGMTEIAGVTHGSGVDSAAANLTFTDVDLNDTHSVGVSSASVVWTNGHGNPTGQGLPNGLQSILDNAAKATLGDSTHSGSGSVGVAFSAADNAFDFLAAGETLTVTYDVTVTDALGLSSTKPVTFTITGTNDAPVLAADASGPHAMTEIANVTNGSGVETSSATLTFTDADLDDGHAVAVSSPLASWTGQGPLPANLQSVLAQAITVGGSDSTHTGAGTTVLTFSAADSAFDFLGAGQTLSVTYNVFVKDSQGATSSVRPVTFTVTGTNDAPVLAADTGVHALTEVAGVTNGSGVQTASTVLGFTDADLNDTHSASATLTSSSWSGGTIPTATFNALSAGLSLMKADLGGTGTGQVTATFSVADKAFDFLGGGETLTATYNVTVSDGHGGSSMQPVTFTVTGTNDAPVLGAASTVPSQTFDFSSNVPNSYNGAGNYYHTEGGFTFSGFIDYPYYGAGGTPGSYVFTGQTPLSGGANADLVHNDGAAFALLHLDVDDYYLLVGAYNQTAADTLTIKGYNHGVLVATQAVSLTAAFQTITLGAGFGNVDDVKFFLTNPTTSSPLLAFFDNLAVGPAGGAAAINLTEAANVTGSTTTQAGSATLTFTDVDLTDHHTASVSAPTAVWSGGSTLPDGLISALTGALTPHVNDSTGTGTGNLSASFSAQDHTFDFLAAGETLTVTYNVTIDDGHGGTSTQPVTVSVTGANDAPVIAADTGSHAASEVSGVTNGAATDSATASLSFTDADLTDSHTAGYSLSSAAWSGGSIPAATLTALASSLSLAMADSRGSGAGGLTATFSLADHLADFLGAGQTLTAVYNVTVSDGHGGTSTKPVTFTVTGTNDAPVLAAGPNLSGAVSFYGAEGNSADTVGHNNGTDFGTAYTAGHDGQAFNFTGSNYSTIGNIIPADFTMSGWLKTTANSLTGSQFYQGNGLVYADVGGLARDFGVSILNNHLAFGTGGNFDSTIQSTSLVNTGDWVNWAVTRSGSIISIYINGVLEASEDTTYAGLLNSPTRITLGANTIDHRYYVGQLDDLAIYNRALSATEIQQHSILGSASVTEAANQTGSSAVTTASVSLTLTDADLTDTHTVSLGAATFDWSGGTVPAGLAAQLSASALVAADTVGTGVGSVTVSLSAADKAFDFLAQGETLKITYDATVNDGYGGTSTQPVTITVSGTNDGPLLAADTVTAHGLTEIAGVTGGSGVESASASLSFSDADLNDSHTFSVSPASAVWTGGSTLPGGLQSVLDGALHATLADTTHGAAGAVNLAFSAADNAFDFLADGETLTVTYNVSVTDSHGVVSATQPVTFTVTGTNDAPVLAAASLSADLGHGATHTLTFEPTEAVDYISGVTDAGTSYDALSDGGFELRGFYQYDSDGNPGWAAYTFTGWTTFNDGASAEIVRSDGQEFSLKAFDAKDYYGAQDEITLLGYDHGVLVASTTIDFSSYQTFTLGDAFSNVDDVRIVVNYGYYEFFDNIQLGAAPPQGNIELAETAGQTGASTAVAGSSSAMAFTDVDLRDHHTASISAPTAVWSGGAALPGGLIAALTGALTPGIADSTGTGSGSLTANFSVQDHTFDFLADGESLTITYNVTLDDGHGGTSAQPVTVVVVGTNDAPVVAVDTAASHAASEATNGSATQVASAALGFTDADLNDTHSAGVSLASAVWSTGDTISSAAWSALSNALSASLSDSQGSGSGQVNLNFALADSAAAFLSAGETLKVTYDVTVTDNHLGASTQPVSITLTGVNANPVLASPELVVNGGFDQGGYAWTNANGQGIEVYPDNVYGVSGMSGPVMELDLNGGFQIDDVYQTVATTSGATYTFSFDTALRSGTPAWTNTFGVYWNGVLIDTVTAASTQAEHHSYTVTAAGASGRIEFKEETYNSDSVGGIIDNVSLQVKAAIALTEQNGSHLAQADTGSATFILTDANLHDTHSVAYGAASAVWSGGAQLPSGLQAVLDQAMSSTLVDSTNSGTGSVTVKFSAADQTFDFLAAGETLKVTYNVTVSDNHGGSSVAPVTVTIAGTEDSPTISGPANILVANTAGAVSLGLSTADPDLTDTLSVTIDSLTNGIGTLELANGTAVAVGQTLTAAQFAGLMFAASSGGLSGSVHYTVNDGHGGSASLSEAISTYTSTSITGSEVLTFDNLPATEIDSVSSGYGASGAFHGFNFNGMGTLAYYSSPYSSPNVLFPVYGVQDTSITTVSGDVHLNGFEIARQWSVTSVLVTFKENGTVVGTQTVNLPGGDDGNAWVYVQGPSSNITEIDLHSNTSGVWWKMDNISLSWATGGATETGAAGSDIIAGGAGADILTGTSGSDTFVFNSTSFGKDTVNAFTAGVDTLQFSHTVFANAATALSHSAQVGSDVVITYDANDTVTLKGVLLTNLHSSDFHII